MSNKMKMAKLVARDLDTLEFGFNDHGEGECLFTLKHPSNKYTIWTANGFWFISLYYLDGKNIGSDHTLSKFGAMGKILVWWKCQKHISKWKKEIKDRNKQKQDEVIRKLT